MRHAVLFDLFNTLVPGKRANGGGRQATIVQMASALGVAPEAYQRIFFGAERERFVDAFGGLPNTVRTLAVRAGGTPSEEQVESASALRRELITDLLAAVPGATLSTLDQLRLAGWRIGLVSNVTPDAPDQWRESKLPPYFDAVAFSSELGVAKPDPEIYLSACRALGVAPAECVYIGDGADNELAGATALGMYAIRTTEHADSDPAWTGLTIGSFAELPAILGAAAEGTGSAVDLGEVPGAWRPGDQAAGRVG